MERIEVCGSYMVTLLKWTTIFVVRNQMACSMTRLDYVLKINRHHSRFNSEHHNWQGLSDDHFSFKRKTITTLTFYNFGVSTLVLKLALTILVINCNC